MKRTLNYALILATCTLALLAACQSSPAGSAAQTVQSYLQARVESNLDKMINLSCPEWEAQARVEATSFKAMKATLDNVSCTDAGANGNFTLVSCQGKIITSYNGESREWSVAERQFKVAQSGGEWRMCGYQ